MIDLALDAAAGLLETGSNVAGVYEFESRILTVESVMGDSVLITVAVSRELAERLRAGHFFDILCRIDGSSDPLLRRPYSVFRVDAAAGTMTFLVRSFGRGSAWLTERRAGDTLNLLGPLGNSYTILPRSRHLLMVAGGVGVAPLVMLTDEAIRRGLDVTYLMGALNESGLLSPSLLPSVVEYVVATNDGSKGHRGFVTDLVPGYVDSHWADQLFSCGPEPMYRSLRAAVLPHRIGKTPTVQVSMERTMACGVGACLGCVVETRHGMQTSCVEGPVFDMDEIVW